MNRKISDWYVVRTKANQEKAAERNLVNQHFVCFLPEISLLKRKRGKWEKVTEPLFPRYLFVQILGDEQDISPIGSTRGVSNIVKFSGHPATVPNEVIFYLRRRSKEDSSQPSIETTFERGEELEVVDGPFSGLSGLYEISKGEERIVVLISLLGRLAKIELGINDVAKR